MLRTRPSPRGSIECVDFEKDNWKVPLPDGHCKLRTSFRLNGPTSPRDIAMLLLAQLSAPPIVFCAAAASLVLLAWQMIRIRREIDGLVVLYSWNWALVALIGQVACLIAMSVEGSQLSSGWVSAFQYLSSILLLTPQVCTLGARKPGAGPWQWFVVLPLIFVLFWPGLSQVVNSHGKETIQLSGPAIAGFCLVTVMSAAPGMGTAATAPALAHLVAVLCCVWPCLSPSFHWMPLLTPFILLWASRMLLHELQRPLVTLPEGAALHRRMNDVWLRFQTCYGLIWARRIQDRMAQFQRSEHWTVTLDIDGFRAINGGAEISDTELQKPLESFRWTLGRFASPEWLDKHLGTDASQ